ncbi:MAG TPA: nuclear transport factor 2 family protein [Fimbriimonadaceae bacterium]|nr:nuclear transport factor 2 family protein [Fimbriimonadaceae bacterium]
MQIDVTNGRLMKALQRLASYIGIGIVSLEDPDYIELCERCREIDAAHRRGDFTTIMTTLDRDYYFVRPDGVKLNRNRYGEQLRARLESQIRTDYREEPAHIIIRGKRAQVATRIYATTTSRKDGKWVEVTERSEHLTVWLKSKSGWKRAYTRVRSAHRNAAWVAEPN